jgi:DNA-binding HxlR family transcriptional regulator
MKRKSFSGMNCSIARALDEVGEWWSLLIVRDCTQGSMRFDELQSRLGIARNILTSRLERLIELGILERFALEDQPKVSGYRLTKKGEALYPILVALMQWGDRWAGSGKEPPTVLVNDATGSPVGPMVVRDEDGRPLTFRDVRFVPGPGALDTTPSFVENRNQRVLGHK